MTEFLIDTPLPEKKEPVITYTYEDRETLMIEIVFDMLFEKLENINSSD